MTIRVATGFTVYVSVLLAAYLMSGPLRATALDRMIGAPLAAVIEGLWLVSAACLGAALIPPAAEKRAARLRASVAGGLAAAVFICVDMLVAIFFCGIDVARHLARFAEPAGWIQAFALALCFLAPLLAQTWEEWAEETT